MVRIMGIIGKRFGINMKNWEDAVATLIILFSLIAGGYFYLKGETDKIIQHKQDHTKETSVLKEYAPKSFEHLVKTTEEN